MVSIALVVFSEYVLSSPAILSFTRNFYFLNDLEYAFLSREDIEFYDIELNKINKQIQTIEWDATGSEKNGYEDFMLKEIFEQPAAIRETVGAKLNQGTKCTFNELNFTKESLSKINKIYIVACGTAMHAGLSGKSAIEKLVELDTINLQEERLIDKIEQISIAKLLAEAIVRIHVGGAIDPAVVQITTQQQLPG